MSVRPSKKAERRSVLAEYWSRPTSTATELDIVDKGDQIEVKACTADVAAWWLGTLRAMYPQDHYSGSGESLKMHPAMGVTLKLNRSDGTLTIKGKKHFQWFKENFEQVLESGDKEFKSISEMGKVIDKYLQIDDGLTIADLLEHLPPSGAVRHGPTYVYRLWKGLLDQWLSADCLVYLITPLLDSKRLADVLLLLAKHKLSRARVQLFTTTRCDGELKFPKVYKTARDMVKELKGPNKKRLIVQERLNLALERLEPKFGAFHCKMIACSRPQYTEMVLTSASFHSMHFHYDHADTVLFMRMPSEDFFHNYLQPLGFSPNFQTGSVPILSQGSSSGTLTM